MPSALVATTALRSLRSSRSSTATRVSVVDSRRCRPRRRCRGRCSHSATSVGVALGERVDDARSPAAPAGAWRARRAGRPGAGRSTTSRRRTRAPERPAVGAQRARRGRRSAARRRRRPRGRWRSPSCTAPATPSGSRSSMSRDAPVVGPEVVAPVGDAVRLVDHQQPDALGEQRQHLVAELRVVEPLGADQQQVDGVGVEQLAHLVPLVAVGRVDRVRADARAARPPRSGCASAPAAARRSASGRRRARAAARWRGSRPPTCPSPCAARTARARGRRRGRAIASSWCSRNARVRPRELAQELGGAVVDGGGGGGHGLSTLGHRPVSFAPTADGPSSGRRRRVERFRITVRSGQ